MLHDSVIATIRTFVPATVGLLISWLVANGVVLEQSYETLLTTALIGVVTAGYYSLVTFLERKVSPVFGWLLGWAKVPAYAAGPPPQPAPQVGDQPLR